MDEPQLVGSVNEAFLAYAEYLEHVVAADGWDQPAMLFAVEGCELPVPADLLESADGLVVPIGFRMRPVLEIAAHPADGLVGTHIEADDLAAVLVTEGWTYHPDRVVQMRTEGVRPAVPPSECEDRVEIRGVYLVARDGTEVTFQRARDASIPDVAHVGPVQGRVAEAVRRVVGLPSRPWGAGDGPTVAQTRNRIMLSLVTDVVSMVLPLGAAAVAWALDNIERERDALYMSCALRFGLFEDDWEGAISAARREAHRRGSNTRAPTPYDDPTLDRLAEWGDGPMWADEAVQRFRPRVEAVLYLEELRHAGALQSEDLVRIIELAERAPIEWDEPF